MDLASKKETNVVHEAKKPIVKASLNKAVPSKKAGDAATQSNSQAPARDEVTKLLQQVLNKERLSENAMTAVNKVYKVTPADIQAMFSNISPTVGVIIGGSVILLLVMVHYLFNQAKNHSQNFEAGQRANGSGRSDYTGTDSDETGSTDRELKNRLERFEKSCSEHKERLLQEHQLEWNKRKEKRSTLRMLQEEGSSSNQNGEPSNPAPGGPSTPFGER